MSVFNEIAKERLPAQWCMTSLGEALLSIQAGKSFRCEEHTPQTNEIGIAKVSAVTWGRYDELESKTCLDESSLDETLLICREDFLFSRANTLELVGACVIAEQVKLQVMLSDKTLRFKLLDDINQKFILYYLKSRYGRDEIERLATGNQQSMRNISQQSIRKIQFPLPPSTEQQRIVDKIEELFSDLDSGINSLKTAQQQLKVYRQAVLKWAFEGKLTAQWREEQQRQGKLESADTLLAQIKAEQEQRYQKELEVWQAEVEAWDAISKEGQKPRKPSKPKELAEISKEDIEGLGNIPESWTWIKIGSISRVGTGVTPLKGRTEYYENGSIPWVTSGALNEAFVRKPSSYVTNLALQETNLRIYPTNTLLIALYGEGKTRGKCSELLIEATTNQAVAAIIQEGYEEEFRTYLKWFLQKNYDAIRRKASGGVQPNLNLGIIENTIFPICLLEEQEKIVEEIESRLSIFDQLEADIEANLKKAEALRQSILKQAFEGKLVPQDPNDEPASVLLERIRKQRQENEATKRTKRDGVRP